MKEVDLVGQMGERREMHVGFWQGNLNGRDHIGILIVDGRIILK
jgi:hypothetical protein